MHAINLIHIGITFVGNKASIENDFCQLHMSKHYITVAMDVFVNVNRYCERYCDCKYVYI